MACFLRIFADAIARTRILLYNVYVRYNRVCDTRPGGGEAAEDGRPAVDARQ